MCRHDHPSAGGPGDPEWDGQRREGKPSSHQFLQMESIEVFVLLRGKLTVDVPHYLGLFVG